MVRWFVYQKTHSHKINHFFLCFSPHTGCLRISEILRYLWCTIYHVYVFCLSGEHSMPLIHIRFYGNYTIDNACVWILACLPGLKQQTLVINSGKEPMRRLNWTHKLILLTLFFMFLTRSNKLNNASMVLKTYSFLNYIFFITKSKRISTCCHFYL